MVVTMSLQEYFKLMASECRYTEELEHALQKWRFKNDNGLNWGATESQILTQAVQFEMTPEKFIDYLFEAKSAREFIFRLEEQKLAA